MKLYDEMAGGSLRRALDDVVRQWPGVETRQMFGCPSYRADGTIFAVVTNGAIALTRLPDEMRGEVEKSYQTRPFGSGERTIARWVNVRVDHARDISGLVPYVEASYKAALAE